MIKWLHHLFNPHCSECRDELEESMICNSCEVLKLQISRLERENERLLNRILEKPSAEEKPVDIEGLKPVLPKMIPWRIRKQMLEEEDRVKAKLMRQSEEVNKQSTEELEKELKIAEQEREEKTS